MLEALQLQAMGYYEDRPPVHAHRTPAELAEDEILAALRGTLRQPFRHVARVLDDNPFETSPAAKSREERRNR